MKATETQEILTTPDDIFRADHEIVSAQQAGEDVHIYCDQFDPDCDYSGGTLILNAAAIEIYDQLKRSMELKALEALCHQYWSKFGSK